MSIAFLHVKVYKENIIYPFWIFHWGHGVPISVLLTVKVESHTNNLQKLGDQKMVAW